jgi:hypothetical protein
MTSLFWHHCSRLKCNGIVIIGDDLLAALASHGMKMEINNHSS